MPFAVPLNLFMSIAPEAGIAPEFPVASAPDILVKVAEEEPKAGLVEVPIFVFFHPAL